MPRLVTFMAALLMTMATAASAETVGFAQVGTESDWRTAFSADMKAEAKARGIDLRFDEAGGNVERQFAAVRRYIAERVDAIIIAPAVVTGWTPVLEEAQAAHIPVFIADRSVDADPSLFVARIAAACHAFLCRTTTTAAELLASNRIQQIDQFSTPKWLL